MALSETDPGSLDQRERFARLMEAIAARQDRAAFAELFAYFAPRVKRYLMRLGAEEGQADELAQETLLTLWRKAEQFDPRQASVSTWLFRIARNRRIDAFRRTQAPPLQADEPGLAPEPELDPEERLGQAQMEVRVRAALTELPTEQLALLKAAFYEGLSHRDIAERDGIALGTVKSRIRLAFQKLRVKLEGDL
jgi:RNA polymerase sigma-70 factor (ECF subfamily)